MKRILLILMGIFYFAGVFSSNVFDENKSYSAYCGKFLVSVTDSKNENQKNNQNSSMNNIRFLGQDEDTSSVRNPAETQHYKQSFVYNLLNPDININYIYFEELDPESIPATPHFTPS